MFCFRLFGTGSGAFFQQPLFQAGIVENHHGDQQDRIDKHPVIVHGTQKLRKDGEQGRRDDGAPDIAETAENHKHQNQDGGVEVKLGRRDGGKVHGIQRTCGSRQSGGNDEGQQTIAGDGDADAFRGNPVVAHRHDGAARPAVDEVEHQKQGDQDEDKACGEGRKLGDAADAHGSVDDHFSVFGKLKGLV